MDEFNKFYNQALRFLSYRSRSEKEIKDNLLKKKASQEVIDQIIVKLREHAFVNDKEFAKSWIESRMRFKPRGIRVIKMELKQKGISQEIIDSQISKLRSSVSNEEMIQKLIQKKITRYKQLPPMEMKQKLFQFLSSKGFEYDDIKDALKDVGKE